MSVAQLADTLRTTPEGAERLLSDEQIPADIRDELDRALALGHSKPGEQPLYGVAVLSDAEIDLLPAGDAQPLFADPDLAEDVAESLQDIDESVCVVPVWPEYAWRRTVAFHAAWGSAAEPRNIFVVDDPRVDVPLETLVEEIERGYAETLRLRAAAEDPGRVEEVDVQLAEVVRAARLAGSGRGTEPPPESSAAATADQDAATVLAPDRPLAVEPEPEPDEPKPREGTAPSSAANGSPTSASPLTLADTLASEIRGSFAETRPSPPLEGEARTERVRAGEVVAAPGSDELRSGTQIGPYRVTSLLGQGELATVYLAERVSSGDLAALKVISSERADDTLRRRFLLESGYASTLEHPNIPRVHDVGEADGYLYIASEYVPGMNLKTLLAAEGGLEPQRAFDLLAQVADALDAVHAHGILHGDVEPANILIASGEGAQPADHCYLTDFGLSKERAGDRTRLTTLSEFVGTSHYTAPEQIVGKECDHRADVYSLGCVLYETLAGEPPFDRPRETEILYAHIEDEPPKLSEKRPDLPAGLDDVIARALAKEPQSRYGSCRELVHTARETLSPTKLGLTVMAGNARGSKIDVDERLLIGRLGPEPGRLGGDVELSAEHARIVRTPDGGYVIEDLGSTSGTSVNGQRIDGSHVLFDGDTIDVGATTLLVSRRSASQLERRTASRTPETQRSNLSPAVIQKGGTLELPKLAFRLDVDWGRGEVLLGFDVNSQPVRLVRDGDRWQVKPDD